MKQQIITDIVTTTYKLNMRPILLMGYIVTGYIMII